MLKIFESKTWIPVLSESDLPSGVLETKEGAFFAGFVAASLRKETGPMETGTTKYSKGFKSYQTFCVEKAYSKSVHLRTGGMDKITERLSNMKGFTKDYWGLRGAIMSLFKSIKPIKVTDLQTYMKSKNEISKSIKTKMPFRNGGVFRVEEIAYLDSIYTKSTEELEQFLATLNEPSEELAKNFEAYYTRVRVSVNRVESEVKPIMAARSRILFPDSKKKKDIKWRDQPLIEKLATLDEKHLVHFRPQSLPGITVKDSSTELFGGIAWKEDVFGRDLSNYAIEVIDSWYGSFESSVEED